MSTCQRHGVEGKAPDPLAAIVDAYLGGNAEAEKMYIRYYIDQPALDQAVTKAAMAELEDGKRFSHQRRIPHYVLEKATRVLLKLDFGQVGSFGELHSLIERTVGDIHGIGELTVYDTAHRLGAYLDLRPEFVYLHAGVRTGVKALGLNHKADKLPISAFPAAFHRLCPEQVEDCLCIYKHELKRLKLR